jgi:hypothetical protein
MLPIRFTLAFLLSLAMPEADSAGGDTDAPRASSPDSTPWAQQRLCQLRGEVRFWRLECQFVHQRLAMLWQERAEALARASITSTSPTVSAQIEEVFARRAERLTQRLDHAERHLLEAEQAVAHRARAFPAIPARPSPARTKSAPQSPT